MFYVHDIEQIFQLIEKNKIVVHNKSDFNLFKIFKARNSSSV